jgi:hypothetical protein
MPVSQATSAEDQRSGSMTTSTGGQPPGPPGCEPWSATSWYLPGGAAMRKVPSELDFPVAATDPSLRTSLRVVSNGRSGQGSSARSTGHVGPACTLPSTPEPDGQGAKDGSVAPLSAGRAQGGGHDGDDKLTCDDPVGAGSGCGCAHGGGHDDAPPE